MNYILINVLKVKLCLTLRDTRRAAHLRLPESKHYQYLHQTTNTKFREDTNLQVQQNFIDFTWGPQAKM